MQNLPVPDAPNPRSSNLLQLVQELLEAGEDRLDLIGLSKVGDSIRNGVVILQLE